MIGGQSTAWHRKDCDAAQVGSVSCNICGERFSTKIHKLSEAIDVYSEWIDACEAENA